MGISASESNTNWAGYAPTLKEQCVVVKNRKIKT